MRRFWLALTVSALALASCTRSPAPPPAAEVHYTVGAPYEIGGVWRYPRADFSYDETGLATVVPAGHGPMTTDGERYDATAMAAGHRTLQLPAIARLTNLDTGLSAPVRLNDRGPVSPGRLVEVTPRVAQLLQIQDSSRVRLQIMETESRQLAASVEGGSPKLDIAAAPSVGVAAESLAPPPGIAAERGRSADALPSAAAVAVSTVAAVPLRLPEQVSREPARSGPLYVEVGTFSRPVYARILQSRLASLGAEIATDYAAPRDRAFTVRLGPFASVGEADAALDRAIAAGVTDASIVVGP